MVDLVFTDDQVPLVFLALASSALVSNSVRWLLDWHLRYENLATQGFDRCHLFTGRLVNPNISKVYGFQPN